MSDLDKYNDLINHHDNGSGDELSEFLRKSSYAQIPAGKGKKAIWDKISTSIDEDQKGRGGQIKIWRFVGVAAAIAIIATFSVIFLDRPVQIQAITSSGESKTETLPDGSQVFLNASSSISYSEDWNRRITLEGEAFFEVKKGEKFIVKTSLGSVQVLGTSFNVFARGGDFQVSCKTGKVRVSVPEKSVEEDLVPGQGITVKMDTVQITFRVPELIGKWKTGEFYFENQPMSKVFKEFERQFSIEIEFEGSEDLLFTGYFRNDKSLESALDIVCAVTELKYQKTGQNKFTISEGSQ